MSRYIRKTKVLFSIAAATVVLSIGAGVEGFQGNHFVNLGDPLKLYEYRYDYARGGGTDFFESLSGILETPLAHAESATVRNTGGVPVLLYHGIVKHADRFGITEEGFKDQMFALKRAGYVTITPEELEGFLQHGDALPEKAVLLTFDDGRLDSYIKADPILTALGFHALMFVAVESSLPSDGDRQTFYINAKDIRKMLASGRWSIGSHALQLTGGFVDLDGMGGKANFLSSKAWIQDEERQETDEEYGLRVTRELVDSQTALEAAFGARVQTFAYPFGDYGQLQHAFPSAIGTIGTVIDKNYQMAFRQVSLRDSEFTLNYPSSDQGRLRRFETPTDWSGEQLVAFLESARDKTLPYNDAFARENGWLGTWGMSSRGSRGLTLSASSTSSGAATFIDGSRAWTDYMFQAVIERRRGTYVTLMARYRDGRNFVSCTYGFGRVKIQERVDGHDTKLADVKAWEPSTRDVTFAVSAKGDAIECFLDGKTVVGSPIGGREGGVGVKVWDERLDTAMAVIKGVSVTSLP